jgi:hypothetical protein
MTFELTTLLLLLLLLLRVRLRLFLLVGRISANVLRRPLLQCL